MTLSQLVIKVEPDQTLPAISEPYLGDFDSQRQRHIQALNPKLTDPDHIEAGQKIRLPGPPQVSAVNSVTPTAQVRELP